MCPPKPKMPVVPPVQQAAPVVQAPAPAANKLPTYDEILAKGPSKNRGGGTTTIVEKQAPQLQDDGSDMQSGRGRRRTTRQKKVAADSDTLVTGGAGVLGETSGSSKELLGA